MSDIDLLSSLPDGVGLTDPTLAYNLSGISDYSTEMPFLNIVNEMRPWIAHTATSWSGMTYQQLEDGGYLDANGWPTSIPPGMSSIGTIWAWGGTDQAGTTAAESRAGTYVLTYEGEGTIQLDFGATIISSEPGRIVFTNPTGTQMAMSITSTDPNDDGNYIRDIAVVPEQYEGLYQTGEIFNPEWLSVVSDARELRFMDWMDTNGTPATDWADRPQVGDATYMGQGAPVEVMVQLANQTGADPWFNIPIDATDDYIRQFATYVKDNLDPGLVAHVEYGNENWNWAFGNTTTLSNEAAAAWGDNGQPAYTNMLNYVAMKATNAALIWDEVFGSEASTRVDNVLGIQTANPWVASQELAAQVWQAMDPDGYVAPSSVFDSIAATTYFGGSIVTDTTLRNELINLIKTEPVDQVNAWLTQQLTDPSVSSSIPNIEAQWQSLAAIADQYGLNLTAYEGGQHVQQSFAVSGLSTDDLNTLTTFLTNYVRSDDMASLYQQLWDAWSQVGDGPFMQYGDVSQSSQYGSWGLLNALGDSNPRADLLTELNDTSASWFGDGGGTQYQQGVIKIADDSGEVLTGTAKQDFLVGGAGNDTFVGGDGNDGINGGDGIDTVVLAGSPDQYTITADGDGYDVAGSGGTDYVINVEDFHFADGQLLTLDQFLNGGYDGASSAPTSSAVTAGDGATGATPSTTPAAVTVAAQGGMHYGDGADTATVGDTASGAGVVISAVNSWSQLGSELGLRSSGEVAYVLGERGGSVSIDGTDVSTSYWSLQEDRAAADGTALTGDALTTAQLLGSVLVGAQDLVLTSGDDTFLGGAEADHVDGGAGADYLAGGAGDDVLLGGAGNDTILGGDGNDTLAGGAGNDILDGGAGVNQVDLTGLSTDYILQDQNDGAYLLSGPASDGVDLLRNIQNFQFSDGTVMTLSALLDQSNQTIAADQADAGPLTLALQGDVVKSMVQQDVTLQDSATNGVLVSGVNEYSALGNSLGLTMSHDLTYVVAAKGATADIGGTQVGASYWSLQEDQADQGGSALTGDALATAQQLGSIVMNASSLTLTSGDDTFLGSSYADAVFGSAGNDWLDGRAGNDTLNGGDGNDVLIGGTGDNTLTGGAGQDRFVISLQDGHDTITDFSNGDTLDLRGLNLGSVAAAKADMSVSSSGDLQFSHDDTTVVMHGLHESDLSWMSLMV